jgi:hypothetical protein
MMGSLAGSNGSLPARDLPATLLGSLHYSVHTFPALPVQEPVAAIR